MPNQSRHQPQSREGHGLLGFVFGLAAGAAAVFLSRPENRQQAAGRIKDAKETLEDTVDKFQQDPEKTTAEVKAKIEQRLGDAAQKAAARTKKKAGGGGNKTGRRSANSGRTARVAGTAKARKFTKTDAKT
ncbi:MAG: hypothetical protein COU69_03245 [Candidatus Pacebacteria bacterium CG10_big_fil_rev_8_21_14_0_10_56_10]|nr:MAG: hypothetical protein COU69_03245 [Candidatus Pacebacteria bacterium CG10_big_fil_rev_8_21_14_0_10_56_10]